MEKEKEEFYNRNYYRYRSLDDVERILDIIVNKRLYGAVYKELNDPMEGKFNKDGLKKGDFENIYSHLKRTRICSLLAEQDGQEFPNDYLMWSHYANGHTGCCIKLNITRQYNRGWDLLKVRYQDVLPKVQGDIKDKINEILSVKTNLWEKENEVRAVKIYDNDKFYTNSPFYHIKISAIYFGYKVTKEKCDFYKKISTSIDEDIKVYRIREEQDSNDCFPKLKQVELKARLCVI